MHQTVYIRFNEGEFLESSTSLFSGVLTYEVDDNSTHYPLLSHYPKAFTNIYVTALMLLLNSSYMVGCINTSTSMSKEFRNYVVRMYNYMLEDFSNNISKYHSENRIEESV